MSSSDVPTAGRRRALAVLALLPLLAAGCGFQPLYGQNAAGSSVDDQLAAVRIQPLKERNGQILHNLLRDRLNPYGQPAEPRYSLSISVSQVSEETGIRRDETASRAVLTLYASYSLVDAQGQVLTQGLARSSSAYNILDTSYASSVSRQDAQERALTELAEDLKLRLASFFSAHAT
jgi:LPS-assembly lipoprotein